MKQIQLTDIDKVIKSDSIIAIGGFTINRKPISIIKEIAKSNIEKIHIYTLAGALDVDLLVEKLKVKKISAAYVGYEGLGFSKIVRKAVECKDLIFEDLTEILYYLRLKAGAIGVPFIPTESIINSDIFKINSACKKIKDPFTKKVLCGVKAINPDFCIIHAQKADKFGNILINEPNFSEKEMAQASKIRIFSVEEIGELEPNEITISSKFVDYIIVAKKGAYPSGCKDHYAPNIKEILKHIEKNDESK
jgi:glutaconate CoA-transferase subunit A|tara:strand:+ start:23577 stop:24323 length:747 start_codon:yes stop_codon:yes gene_type:complete